MPALWISGLAMNIRNAPSADNASGSLATLPHYLPNQ